MNKNFESIITVLQIVSVKGRKLWVCFPQIQTELKISTYRKVVLWDVWYIFAGN